MQTEEVLPQASPEITNSEAEILALKAQIAELKKLSTVNKAPAKPAQKMKKVKARIIDESGDLVMAIIEVPEDFKGVEIKPGTRITPDYRDAQAGNPEKDPSLLAHLDD